MLRPALASWDQFKQSKDSTTKCLTLARHPWWFSKLEYNTAGPLTDICWEWDVTIFYFTFYGDHIFTVTLLFTIWLPFVTFWPTYGSGFSLDHDFVAETNILFQVANFSALSSTCNLVFQSITSDERCFLLKIGSGNVSKDLHSRFCPGLSCEPVGHFLQDSNLL